MSVSQFLLAFCADNLFADTQYPQNVVSGDQEPAGYEAWRVGVGRRHPVNRWQPTTTNVAHAITVNCKALAGGVVQPVPRAVNFLAIDRAANLLGQRVQLQGSDDNFLTTRAVFDATLPTVPGGQPDGALGCVTDEGAFLKIVPTDVHNDWSLYVFAMGTGLVPQVPNLTLGFAWIPAAGRYVGTMTDETQAVQFAEDRSPAAWAGRTKPATPRRGRLDLLFTSELDDDVVAWQALGLFARGQPAWLLTRRTDAPWRAMYVRLPAGDLSLVEQLREPGLKRLQLPFEEDQPLYV